MGSFDKDNFYTKEEELPEDRNHYSPKYSSIMDYGGNELNELPVIGKYDIAALRYAYANEIELNNGDYEKISGELPIRELNAKQYLYYTDENAGNNLWCNRYDEGTNFTEIIKFYIDSYHNNYSVLNTRDNRESFKSYTLSNYIWGIKRNMSKIRER